MVYIVGQRKKIAENLIVSRIFDQVKNKQYAYDKHYNGE